VAAVNKMQGRKVTAALIKPALKALKLRYRLGVLEPVVQDGYWAVRGDIRRVEEEKTTKQSSPEGTGSSDPIFEAAKNGGKHAGFYNNYKDKDERQICRGIASIEEQIAEHEDKIKNPEKYISDFANLDPRQQKALIERKWPSDIARQKEQKAILEGILTERSGNG
jgi:hypothetical protein